MPIIFERRTTAEAWKSELMNSSSGSLWCNLTGDNKAIELTTQSTATVTLPSVERHRQILLLHDVAHVAREYFIIENRFPGASPFKNYDAPLGQGAVVVWQIFEDRNLVDTAVVCHGDPRFIRRRAVLMQTSQFTDLTWADGSSAGFRISLPKPNAEQAEVRLERIPTVLPPKTSAAKKPVRKKPATKKKVAART